MTDKKNREHGPRIPLGINISKLIGQAKRLKKDNPAKSRHLRKIIETYGHSV